jgi:hypothetical protein
MAIFLLIIIYLYYIAVSLVFIILYNSIFRVVYFRELQIVPNYYALSNYTVRLFYIRDLYD